MDPSGTSGLADTMAEVAAELRAFVATLKQRPDVVVEVAALGGPAPTDDLARAEIPPDLLAFYAAMNGIHVEWRFVEPPGGGCMRVPPLSGWTRFAGDDETYMGFGDAHEALLLDEITPEGGTWLVRERATGEVRIVFASAGRGYDGVEAADSLESYFRAAMESGFVDYWPRCFEPSPYVSYAEQEEALERFRAAPREVAEIVPGARVTFEYFSEGGRGEVLALHEAPTSEISRFCGIHLARVKLDEGSVAWLPTRWMKVQREVDAYERLREPTVDLGSADLADVVRAIGPLAHFSASGSLSFASNGRRAAGLLATRALADAVGAVVRLAGSAGDLDQDRTLERTGDEFSAPELARSRWRYTPSRVLTGLFSGLVIRVHHESARRGVAPRELLDPALVERLRGIPLAEELVEALAGDTPLAAPSWSYDPSRTNEQQLALPTDEPALLGSGY